MVRAYAWWTNCVIFFGNMISAADERVMSLRVQNWSDLLICSMLSNSALPKRKLIVSKIFQQIRSLICWRWWSRGWEWSQKSLTEREIDFSLTVRVGQTRWRGSRCWNAVAQRRSSKILTSIKQSMYSGQNGTKRSVAYLCIFWLSLCSGMVLV